MQPRVLKLSNSINYIFNLARPALNYVDFLRLSLKHGIRNTEYGIRNKYSFTNSRVSTKVSTVKAAYKELDFSGHAVQLLVR